MKIEIENEREYKNKKYVHIENGSDHLVIILNTHNQGDRYFGYKTISESNKKVDLLFIVDPYNKYYLDDNEGETYKELIEYIAKNYLKDNISIFGTSMAGYAALYFGITLKLNIIAINPQINLDSAKKLAWPQLKETLTNLTCSCDLEKLIVQQYSGQSIFLTFGQHRLDKQAYSEFMNLCIKDMIVNIRLIDSLEHKFFLSDLTYVEQIHFLGVENKRINKVIRA